MEGPRAEPGAEGEGRARECYQGENDWSITVGLLLSAFVQRVRTVLVDLWCGTVRKHEMIKTHLRCSILWPSQEREDTLRRRNMTDDERRMEDMMLGKHQGKDKDKIKFMQKYYHKGAFYMVSSSAGRLILFFSIPISVPCERIRQVLSCSTCVLRCRYAV